jgi:GNAT superfamily N-acetyltransferase
MATAHDLSALFELEQRAFETDWFTRNQIEYFLTESRATTFVLEDKSSVVGVACVLWRRMHHSARLYNLAIDPTRQRRRLGRRLFEDVQRSFRNHNKPQLNRKQFAFGNLMTCEKCGAKITAELKKGKYVYYHCTGMKPGGCDLVYVREAEIVDQFSDLLGRCPRM